MGAILLLEDGRRFEGEAFGATATRVGEVVFNTAMTGYQEVLTDPSYAEQVVVMTFPHIGNYGVNEQDPESDRVHVSGFVARAFSRAPSSWRSEGGLHHYLVNFGVPGMHGVDTRALVRHIRTRGAMKCVISTDGTPEVELARQMAEWPGMEGRALATEVGTRRSYLFAEPEEPVLRVSVVDGGCKQNILRLLAERGCRVAVHPIDAPASVWLDGADALFVSNGPGDPAALTGVIAELQKAVGQVPALGICLGHQLLALSLGATTYKLKFGHRGTNHPVRDERSGKVEITSQNHGFAVERESLTATGAEVTHLNLNDHTVSGFVHPGKRVMAVQYHPEACPGPHDSQHLIDRFVRFAQDWVQ
ncbi:MAG: glutamine-hydrolyzing carbamoyl-phosphate synthase small subunit [Deltaproteobacteria bacterium]|nr:glutamine-hydrolyzing carbamoyl-phosphate synthase small subunit [Deltaproteobacteria bacterium]